MKKHICILLIAPFLVSCAEDNLPENLLSDISKWKSAEEIEFSNDVLTVNDEFKTYVYSPGIFKTYDNFEFSAEIKTLPGASAAILLHTNKRDLKQGYEVRIDNSQVGDWEHLLKTGSLSGIRNINYKMVNDEEWFTLKIRVEENRIQISVNNYPVVDYIEPEMPFRTANIEKKSLSSGTFALSSLFGNTGFKIKNMEVIKLPPSEIITQSDPDFVRLITQLHSRHLPLADYHVHEKGDLTLPFLIEKSAKSGINYGVAANCGLKFPIQTDEELRAYQASIKGMPIFKAMQAEGREWVDMFSPELIAEFDYAFTDAMTWTNKKGQRMRLWIPEETFVGDPQDFMEQLVSQIEKIVKEPISIYVNPSFLPEEIADQYEELWTDERIDRVIEALKENGVALEINSRLKLPGKRFIEKAKIAGVKFAMGTNNTNSENLGKLEWALEMVEEFNLQPTDMFLPGGE